MVEYIGFSNAIKKRKQSQDDRGQHTQAAKGGKAAQAGDRNRTQSSGEEQSEEIEAEVREILAKNPCRSC